MGAERKIAWEFYTGILGTDDDKTTWPQDGEDDGPGYENNEAEVVGGHSVLITDFGILPLNPNFTQDNFDIWIGHTNFEITTGMAEAIDNIPGIEAIKYFSRYRFMLCVGKMFNSYEVKLAIQNLLCNNTDSEYEEKLQRELTLLVEIEKTKLTNKQYWALYVLPNNKVITEETDEDSTEYQYFCDLVENVQEMVGGVFETSS